MKSKGKFAKLTLLSLLVATLTIYAANRAGGARVNAAPATSAQTETPPTTEFAFGGISIGRGQTASIIVVCLPDPSGRDQRPVEAEFMFRDWDGNLLASETKTILPGHTSSFDSRGIISVSRERVIELAPCLSVFVDPKDPRANRIVGSLEVCETATGKTQAALYCRKSGGDPQQY